MIYREENVYAYFGHSAGAAVGGRLLCWIPETPEVVSSRRRRPAVLILPGGAYQYTSPREAEPIALRFAAQGYAAFVLHYSCAPSRFPTALREAAMSMRCIRDLADSWGIDPHMVAAIGFSAGGHLCGTLGTLYDAPEVADLGTPAQLRPDGLALCYPVAVSWGDTHEESFQNISGGDSRLRQRLSLESLVRPDMPPVFLWHTRDDGSVPCRNSLILAQALDAAGVDFAMHIYRRGVHGLSTADAMVYPAQALPEVSWDVPGWIQSAIRFFAEIGIKIADGDGEV